MDSWLVMFEGQPKSGTYMQWGEPFYGTKDGASHWAQMKVDLYREHFNSLSSDYTATEKMKEML